MIAQQPIVGVVRNPLLGLRPQDMRAVRVGATIAELAPEDPTKVRLVCSVTGIDGYLLPTDWHKVRVTAGDIVVFEVDPPGDKSALRGILQVALIAFTIWNPLGWSAGALAAANIAANAVLSDWFAVTPTANGEQASPSYSTSLSGNPARLDAPIPKICGRHRIVPSFAGQPYREYDAAGDEYFFAVYCIGVGNHSIERTLIDDTDIRHFADVLVNAYLPPGTQPGTCLANVTTAVEVSTQELVSGQFVGGYTACSPRKTAAALGFDIVLQGLGVQSGGAVASKSVTVRFDYRTIDDFGAATGAWVALPSVDDSGRTTTITAATTAAVRRSFKYTLVTAARVEARAIRTDVKDETLGTMNSPVWAGLRAYLAQAAPLNADTAYYEIKLRASEQLSQLSQRQVAMIVNAYVRTWAPGSPGWGAEQLSRNPAWWLVDLLSNAVWGEGLPDSRIDLQSFYELSLIWDARQDRFDYVFDTTMDSWDALQLIARAGRARVFRRYGIYTIARDELIELPVTAFTPRNTIPGTMVMSEALPTRDSPDGFIVEYFDNRAWDWIAIECPCPGVVTMSNPVRKRLPGITGATHAEREGLYDAADILYRRRRGKCTVEMEGLIPTCLSPVRWQPEILGYGQSGDVAFWDEDTLTMGLTEPPTFTDSNYLTLVRDDGSLTTPVAVTPGPTEFDVVLPGLPDFQLILDDGQRERPKFIFGPLDTCDEMVKVTSISDGGTTNEGSQLYALECFVDDERVHAVDNHLLPGPGDIQDPIDTAADTDGGDTGSGTIVIVELTGHEVFSQLPFGTTGCKSAFRIMNDGSAETEYAAAITMNLPFTRVIAHEWLRFNPHEVATAALYEVLAEVDTAASFPVGASITGGDPLSTWLNCGTSREWYMDATPPAPDFVPVELYVVHLVVYIREISSGLVQAVATMPMYYFQSSV